MLPLQLRPSVSVHPVTPHTINRQATRSSLELILKYQHAELYLIPQSFFVGGHEMQLSISFLQYMKSWAGEIQ